MQYYLKVRDNRNILPFIEIEIYVAPPEKGTVFLSVIKTVDLATGELSQAVIHPGAFRYRYYVPIWQACEIVKWWHCALKVAAILDRMVKTVDDLQIPIRAEAIGKKIIIEWDTTSDVDVEVHHVDDRT